MSSGPLTVPHRRPPFKSLIRLVGGDSSRVPSELAGLRLDDLSPTRGRGVRTLYFELWVPGPDSVEKRIERLKSIHRQPADYAEFVVFSRVCPDLFGLPIRYLAHRACLHLDRRWLVFCCGREETGIRSVARVELVSFDGPFRDSDTLLMTVLPEYAHLRLSRS